MSKVGRNDPCPCGSGKKYKNCHQEIDAQQGGRNKAFLIGILLILFVVIAAVGVYLNSQNSGSNRPAGAAPAGKVWSEEHGHYH